MPILVALPFHAGAAGVFLPFWGTEAPTARRRTALESVKFQAGWMTPIFIFADARAAVETVSGIIAVYFV